MTAALAFLAGCGSVTPAQQQDDGAAGASSVHEAGVDVSPADVPSSGGAAGHLGGSAGAGGSSSDASSADAPALAGMSCYKYEPSSYKLPDGGTSGLTTRSCPRSPGCYACAWGDNPFPSFDGSGCSGGPGVVCYASCDLCPGST